MQPRVRSPLAVAGAVALLGFLAACGDSTTTTTLSAPTGVTAAALSPTSVQVNWNQVAGATSYDVDRAEGDGAFANIKTGVTTTVVTDEGLTASTDYKYQVRAVAGSDHSDYSSPASVTTPAPGAKVATVTAVALSRTFYADTTYVLKGYVKVTNGATLTIQPGTKIVGDTTVTGSSLWILRGSKLIANGTADSVIVFTSQRSPGNRAPGDWGGIIMVGNGLINRTASPIYTEGPTTGVAEDYSGGNDFNDSSGSLKYVRVEFAGYDVSNGGGQELNSISNYAVGRGTTLDYVQLLEGLDDGIESFGGAGDYRHIVSFETGDDHFDWTEGFQGRAQYLIALQTTVPTPRPGTGTVSSDPRGFEGDGCEIDKAGCTFRNQPWSQPVWANFTVVGPGTGVFSTTDGNGAVVRRGSGGTFVNGIIARWPGVSFSIRDTASKELLDADSLYVRNLFFVENGSAFEAPANDRYGYVLSDSATQWNLNSTATLANTFSGAVPDHNTATVSEANLNLALAAGAAAATGGLNSFTGTPIAGRVTNFFGGTMPATAYAGALDPSAGTPWYAGWTNWARN